MRILFVNIEGNMAGAEHSLLLLTEELGISHQIVVASPSKSPLEAVLKQRNIQTWSIPVRPLGSHRSVRNVIHWTKVWSSLALLIKDFKPDFIHANTFYCAPPCLVAGLLTNTQVIVHARDVIRSRFLHKIIGTLSSSVVAVSHSIKVLLMDQGIPPSKICVIPNGLNAKNDATTIPKWTSEIGCFGNTISSNAFVYANIGQFVPWKNHRAFLNAAYHVAGKVRHCRFVVIGDDVFKCHSKLEDELKQQCLNLNIHTLVQFLCWQQDLSSLWPKIHCLVHTADQEPFGRVIIEAMANHIPVIAMNAYGPSEIITQNITGLLVSPNDTRQLVEAMVEIASNRVLYRKIAIAAKRHVHHNYASSQTTQRIDNLYRKLMRTG